MGEKELENQGEEDYIPEGEEVVSRYNLGLYQIITTKERLFILRKFPKSFTEILYSEIIGLEHYTKIKWSHFSKSIIFLFSSMYLFIFNQNGTLTDAIQKAVESRIPEFLGINLVNPAFYVFISLTFIYGLLHFSSFIPYFIGVLKISRDGRHSYKINTTFSKSVKSLIREISGHMGHYHDDGGNANSNDLAEKAQVKVEDVADTLHSECDDLMPESIVLVQVQSNQHTESVATLLDMMINERSMGGVYISLTRPYDYILKALDKAQTKSGDIYFIDCISQMAGKVPDKTDKNIVFIENPSSLEEITMYLDRMFSRVTSKNKFLFIDSLSSLMIYNAEKSVKEFTHFIINKMRIEGVTGLFLTIEKKEADNLIETLTPMCDKVVKL